jgi:type II secretory pathway predicted ATPase ExeA
MNTRPKERSRLSCPISLNIPGPCDAEPKSRTLAPLESKLCERYGLRDNPFGNTPDPRYLYQSATHREALSSLRIGVECGVGFQALIAPPGMGKTTVLFHLLSRFSAVARTAFLFQLQGDSREFLHNFLLEMGSDADRSDLRSMQEKVRQLLLCEARAGRRTILVIDEAQDLETPVLETIRMLSNFELPNRKLLQIILAGQPQLGEKLARPELAQLYQRIFILTRLAPLGLGEIKQYVAHRLEFAGYEGPGLFTGEALQLLWQYSGGVPRNVNRLCFNALLAGGASRSEKLDSDLLQQVITDLDIHTVCNTGYRQESGGGEAPASVPADSLPWSLNDTLGDDALEEIVGRIQSFTRASAVALALRYGKEMVCCAKVGAMAPELGSRVDWVDGLTGECICTGKTLRCDDSECDLRVNRQACRRLGVRSIVAIPLRDREEIVGVVEMFSVETNAFRSLDRSVLQAIAGDLVAFSRAVDRTPAPGLGSFCGPHSLAFQQDNIATAKH